MIVNLLIIYNIYGIRCFFVGLGHFELMNRELFSKYYLQKKKKCKKLKCPKWKGGKCKCH